MAPDAGPLSCTVDPEHVWKIGRDSGSDRTVGLAAGATSFGVVWTQVPEGRAISEVHGLALSSSGTLGTPQQISQPPGVKRPPTIVPVGTAWVAGWVDNSIDVFDVRTRALASDLSPQSGSSLVTITDTPAALEDNPVFLESSSGVLLAWIEDDMTALTRTVRVRALDTSGAPTGPAQTASASDHRPGQLAIGELSDGPVLVWTEGSDGTGEVYLQPLTESGAADGAATALSIEANADGTIDAALFPSGGAIVFGALVEGVRRDVRFRALDGEGTPLGDERVLGNGTDASIAAFAGGYAVSYRTAGAAPEIHLVLVSSVGEVLDEIMVSGAAAGGGRTTLRASGDGRVAIAWADHTDTGVNIELAYVTCGAGG